MPRKITDESGTEVEVFDVSEVEALKAEAEKKQKDLEQELNPNWREARQKMKEMEEKLAKAGIKEPAPAVDKEEVARIASEQAEKKYMERYRDRVLDQFGEKKDVVKKVFDKLASGEQLTEDAIDRITKEAARAAGVSMEPDKTLQSRYAVGGGRPSFEEGTKDEGFGATERGKATAAAMGLIIEVPKQ